MSRIQKTVLHPFDLDIIATHPGRVVVFADREAPLARATKRADRLTKGTVTRAIASERFEKLDPGSAITLNWPLGMQAEALQIVRMPAKPDTAILRKAGLSIGKAQSRETTLICADALPVRELTQSVLLRA